MNNFEKLLDSILYESEDMPTASFTMGDKVVVDSSRFKSGRDPGRRKESYTGTVKKLNDTHCMVEFDSPITIKGKKVMSMSMKHAYIKPLEETDE